MSTRSEITSLTTQQAADMRRYLPETLGAKLRRLARNAESGNPLTRPPMLLPSAWTTGASVRQGEVYSSNSLWWVALSAGTAGATAPAFNASNPVVSDGTVLWSCIGAPTATSDDGQAPTVSTTTSTPSGLTNAWFPATLPDLFSARGGYPATLATTGWRVYTCNWGAGTTVGRFPSVKFRCDDLKLAIKLGANRKGVRILIDGRYLRMSSLSWTSDTWVVLDFTSVGGRRWRTFEVEVAQDQLDFLGVYTSGQGMVAAPAPAEVRAAFLSDSIMAGSSYGPFMAGGDLPHLIGKALGWDDCWNFAIGGTGDIANAGGAYYTFGQRVPELLTRNPSPIVMMGSTNDRGQSASAITAARLSTLETIRAGSTSPIIVLGVLPVNDSGYGTGSKNSDIEGAVESAVSQFADDSTYFVPMTGADFPPISGSWNNSLNPSSSNASVYINASDIIHPVDIGTAHIANWAAERIKSEVLAALP